MTRAHHKSEVLQLPNLNQLQKKIISVYMGLSADDQRMKFTSQGNLYPWIGMLQNTISLLTNPWPYKPSGPFMGYRQTVQTQINGNLQNILMDLCKLRRYRHDSHFVIACERKVLSEIDKEFNMVFNPLYLMGCSTWYDTQPYQQCLNLDMDLTSWLG